MLTCSHGQSCPKRCEMPSLSFVQEHFIVLLTNPEQCVAQVAERLPLAFWGQRQQNGVLAKAGGLVTAFSSA